MSPFSCFILERNGSSFAQQKKGGAIGGRSASLQEVYMLAADRVTILWLRQRIRRMSELNSKQSGGGKLH